jgi:hypothetical protein
MQDNKWVRLLAYITGLVNQRLLLQCEYLAAENRILRSHLPVAGPVARNTNTLRNVAPADVASNRLESQRSRDLRTSLYPSALARVYPCTWHISATGVTPPRGRSLLPRDRLADGRRAVVGRPRSE